MAQGRGVEETGWGASSMGHQASDWSLTEERNSLRNSGICLHSYQAAPLRMPLFGQVVFFPVLSNGGPGLAGLVSSAQKPKEVL